MTVFLGCGSASESSEDIESVGTVTQALDAPRTRVVQEASFAMSGNYNTYTTDNWPAASTKALYYYTLTDTGAWNLLLNSSNYGPTGYYVSCMRTRATGQIYTPCQLSTTTGFGSFEMPYYTCQGSCPSQNKRGGQCKPFMNLVAYRSGQYQGPNYAFKAFPNDATISASDVNGTSMPAATYANILPGDFLRRPYGHAAIVVRKISSSQVVVFDSNWVDGNGAETVASHTLGFSGSGDSNLSNYRVLKCAYTGTC